ncbi:MAG: LuxR family transcriptional regulator [Actinobacteria bacterium]|nr:MAG: LuxR family transcriptional regulator [Actinomycetota bacterium]
MCAVARRGVPVEVLPAGGRGRVVQRSALFELLARAERVVLVSAPAGSGKTLLLRSWIGAEGLSDCTGWVAVGREQHDPQVFWLSVLDALRGTRAGAKSVREVTAAPGLDGATIVERLVKDLSTLEEPLWLVIDDLHELRADEAVQQLELLVSSAPAELRFVLLTRSDPRLGLHRVRLAGELTEIRGEDLRFTLAESRALLEAAGVQLSDGALESLVGITEGWAAGLRLAALSMAGHPDPERLAVSFSGGERAVAEYLLAEVLERQPEEVSRLLLRTSVLDRVSGPLADRVTGRSGSERILVDLEDAGAFVVSLDPQRRWFRYHHLFADLLALELRRSAPEELPALHTAAAAWFAEHDYPIEAIRHAQSAEDWALAARLLTDSWRGLYVEGRIATARDFLSRFPASMVAANAELAALAAGDKRAAGSLHEAERYLKLAARMSASVPEERRGRFRVHLALVRLALARARNDVQSVAEEARRLLAWDEAAEAVEFGLGEDLRITALADLGSAETWAGQFEAAERHLERALAEARRLGTPLLELQALAHLGLLSVFLSQPKGEARARQAIDLARKHGWEETAAPNAAAHIALGSVALWRGRLQEAAPRLDRAERALRHFAQPATALTLYATRALLEFARGRHAEAASAYRAVERIERLLITPHILARRARAANLEMLVQTGETERVRQALAEMDDDVRETAEMRLVRAALTLAQDDPQGAVAALAPILDGSTPMEDPRWEAQALLLEATARDALRDHGAASRTLERALDLAEPDGLLLPFLLFPARELLERHSRSRTNHASLMAEILDLLSGHAPRVRPESAEPLHEPLTDSELRVLRYLPTNLQAPQIAAELFVSLNTIRTHLRHLYAKLGVHRRADAVERARELGLLSPSSHGP